MGNILSLKEIQKCVEGKDVKSAIGAVYTNDQNNTFSGNGFEAVASASENNLRALNKERTSSPKQ